MGDGWTRFWQNSRTDLRCGVSPTTTKVQECEYAANVHRGNGGTVIFLSTMSWAMPSRASWSAIRSELTMLASQIRILLFEG